MDPEHIFAHPWGFRLQDLAMTVNLWHGDEDHSTSLTMGQYMADTIPNSRPRFLGGEGHLFFFDRWGEILDLLLP